jgi:ABC-2 type transport system permease protein
MRSHVISAVFKRNVTSYFSGMLGYLFIVVFVVAGAFAAFNARFFANNLANLDQLSYWFPYLLLFLVPAITMTVWSDEKKLGTDELLFTLPASDFEILIGKYLAVLAVYTIALLFSLAHVFVLTYYGSPDLGVVATTYVGYWLAGAALVAVGMFASVLTGSVTVAFVLGAALCAIPIFIGMVPGMDWLRELSVIERLRDFTLGVIPLQGVIYFVSLAAFALYLNAVMIARRHWAGGQRGTSMGWQFVARAVSLAVALICVNYIVSMGNARADMTAEKLFTPSQTTRQVIASIPDDKPVTIEVYLSPVEDVPQQYVAIRKKLVGLLRDLESRGGSKLQVHWVEVQPFSEAAETAEKWGIQPRTVTTEDQGGRYVRREIFLGTVTRSGYDEVVVPFYGVGDSVEYELTRSLGTVSNAERLTVGILDTDAKLMGGFNMQRMSSDPEWRIVTELKKQYNVIAVSPDAPIEEQMDVLIAVMPSSLTEQQLPHLVDYVKSGRPTLIFDDPVPAWSIDGMGSPTMAPLMPKPSPGGGGMFGMQQQQGEPKAFGGRLTPLLNALDIAWDPGEVVFDAFNPHPKYEVQPEIIFVKPESGSRGAFNPESPITKDLREMVMFLPGSVKPRDATRNEFTKLLLTGARNSGTLGWDDITQPGMFGGRMLRGAIPRTIDEYAHILAAEIRSKGSTSGDKGLNAIFVADSDVIGNQSFALREADYIDIPIDNVTFVLNAVDALAGEDRYLALRSRTPQERILEVIEQRRQQYTEEQLKERAKARADAEERLEAARERLQAEVDKLQNDDSLDPRTKNQLLRTAQQNISRQLELQEAEINRERDAAIRKAENESKSQIKAIEDRVWLWAVLIPPIPAIIVGLTMLCLRITNERSNIDPKRHV